MAPSVAALCSGGMGTQHGRVTCVTALKWRSANYRLDKSPVIEPLRGIKEKENRTHVQGATQCGTIPPHGTARDHDHGDGISRAFEQTETERHSSNFWRFCSIDKDQLFCGENKSNHSANNDVILIFSWIMNAISRPNFDDDYSSVRALCIWHGLRLPDKQVAVSTESGLLRASTRVLMSTCRALVARIA